MRELRGKDREEVGAMVRGEVGQVAENKGRGSMSSDGEREKFKAGVVGRNCGKEVGEFRGSVGRGSRGIEEK